MEEFKRVPTTAIRARTVIEQLPPAQRTKGKWITEEENYIKQVRCSECGKNALRVFVADDYYGNCAHSEVKITNFCPYCGADMRTAKCGTKIDLCIIDEMEGLEK